MRDYATQKPKGSHGVHKYSLAEVGLAEDRERERFAFYLDHYRVAEERS